MYKVRCKEGGRGGSAYVVTLFNVRWGEGVKNGLQLAVVLNTWSQTKREISLIVFCLGRIFLSFLGPFESLFIKLEE